MKFNKPGQALRIGVIAAAIYLACFGVAMAFFPIRPFWNDEWRLIYNLKFKTAAQLWGRLDLLQECPRMYLMLLKKFTAYFDYSYASLRSPALFIGIINIFAVFGLRKKIYATNTISSYLFVLIIIASQTFTDYLTQVKQYEMEILASLFALWQLVTLLDMQEGGVKNNKTTYILLCTGSLVIPFFSYTYPIAIVAAFPVVGLAFMVRGKQVREGVKKQSVVLVLLPLTLICISIFIFYLADVKNMLADRRMYHSYLHMLGNEKGEMHFFTDLWDLFALVGFGYVYERIFGVLGVISFGYAIYHLCRHKLQHYKRAEYLQLYGVLLLFITIGLFFSGKLLGGVARLTAYSVPSIGILIVAFIEKINITGKRLAGSISIILFIGLFGNIITTCINSFTYREYNDRVRILHTTSAALLKARVSKTPFLYTDGVRGDKFTTTTRGQILTNTITPQQIAGLDTLCTEVIVRVNPEYKVWDTVALYQIPDINNTQKYMQQLPPKYTSVVVSDGKSILEVRR